MVTQFQTAMINAFIDRNKQEVVVCACGITNMDNDGNGMADYKDLISVDDMDRDKQALPSARSTASLEICG